MNINHLSNALSLSANQSENSGVNALAGEDDKFQQLLQHSQKTQSVYSKNHRPQQQVTEEQLPHHVLKTEATMDIPHLLNGNALTTDENNGESTKSNKDKKTDEDDPIAIVLATGLVLDAKEVVSDADSQIKLDIAGQSPLDKQGSPQLNKQAPQLGQASRYNNTENNVDSVLPEAELIKNPLSKNSIEPSAPSTSAANLTFQSNQALNQGNEINLNTANPNQAFTQLNIPNPPSTSMPTVTLPVAVNNPQWQDSFSQQIVMFSRQDIQKAELRLNPEELGSLHIKLEMNDGKMQLHMAAAHASVKGVLESALPHLRTSLAEQGIDLQQADISDSSMMANSDQQSMFGQHKGSKTGQPRPPSLPSEGEVEHKLAKESVVQSGLSVFA